MKPLNILLYGWNRECEEILRERLEVSEDTHQLVDSAMEAKELLACMHVDLLIMSCDGIKSELGELVYDTKRLSPDTEMMFIFNPEDTREVLSNTPATNALFLTRPLSREGVEAALHCVRMRIGEVWERDYYIDEMERLLEEKAEALKRAENLSMLGQTVGELAHSIKNIVSGLKGGMYVLDQGVATGNQGQVGEGWEMVKRNVERISNLAMELLKLVKEPELIMTRRDPNDPPREVFKLMEMRAREHGVVLDMHLSPNLPMVYLDAEAIHSCLLNLVTNAIDACAESQCVGIQRITIQTRISADGGVQYRVIDNGCGMDDNVSRKLFRCLVSTKGAKGTGLGLLVTKRVIDAHGGTIDVQSEKDRGTVFTIHLPPAG